MARLSDSFRMLAFLVLGVTSNITHAKTCSSSAIRTPRLPGISILSLLAEKVNDPSFCNVTITYTHLGKIDSVNVGIGLPDTWNGRFQGVGGGGWLAGLTPTALVPAVASGYAAGATDAGHYTATVLSSAANWALTSPGHVNTVLLEDFASVALSDMTLLGKQVTESYYGKEIFKSYWNGCSTGGRQGHMLAQRYPTLYDGIHAGSPAINWAHVSQSAASEVLKQLTSHQMTPAGYWPQYQMNRVDTYPDQCEFDTITAAAIEACDSQDGFHDGIISIVGACDYDAQNAVGLHAPVLIKLSPQLRQRSSISYGTALVVLQVRFNGMA